MRNIIFTVNLLLTLPLFQGKGTQHDMQESLLFISTSMWFSGPSFPLLYFIFFKFFFKKLILFEYNCFTVFCQFLLYNKMNQLTICLCPLFRGFPSHLGHHRSLSGAPCAIQLVLISYLFYTLLILQNKFADSLEHDICLFQKNILITK